MRSRRAVSPIIASGAGGEAATIPTSIIVLKVDMLILDGTLQYSITTHFLGATVSLSVKGDWLADGLPMMIAAMDLIRLKFLLALLILYML